MEPSILSTIDTKNNSEKLSIPKQQSVDTNRQKDNQILSNTIDELEANNYSNTDPIPKSKNNTNKNNSSESNNKFNCNNSSSTNNLNFDSNQKCQTNSSGDLVNRSNERLLMYKEYVNHIYNNDDSLPDCDLEKQNSQNQLSSVMTCSSSSSGSSSTSKKIDKSNGEEDSEDVEPLLETRDDNDEVTKFKGIIKSPSSNSFSDKKVPLILTSSAKVRNANKRLSWQESSSNSNENCERPTNLHVQFVSPPPTSILLPQSSSKKHGDLGSQASTPSKNSVRIQDENLESNSSGSSSSDEDDSEDK